MLPVFSLEIIFEYRTKNKLVITMDTRVPINKLIDKYKWNVLYLKINIHVIHANSCPNQETNLGPGASLPSCLTTKQSVCWTKLTYSLEFAHNLKKKEPDFSYEPNQVIIKLPWSTSSPINNPNHTLVLCSLQNNFDSSIVLGLS